MAIPQQPPTEDDPPAPFVSPDLADIAARLDRIEAIVKLTASLLRDLLDAVHRISGKPP